MVNNDFDNKENLGHGIKGQTNAAAKNIKDNKNNTNNNKPTKNKNNLNG